MCIRDRHYILSDSKYPFTFSYAGQDTEIVEIAVNEGKPIEDVYKRQQYLPAKGMTQLVQTISRVKKRINPGLKLSLIHI